MRDLKLNFVTNTQTIAMDKSLSPLYNYLNAYDSKNSSHYFLLRYVFDQKIYYYGNNFKHPHERRIKKSELFKIKLLGKLYEFFVFFNAKFNSSSNDKIKIWSTAYFKLEEKIDDEKYHVFNPPWVFSRRRDIAYNYELHKKIKEIKHVIVYGNFNELVNENFFRKIDELKQSLKNHVLKENIRAVLLPHDLGFFERLVIQIFKEIGRPSFLLIHGLPGIYGKMDNNRTDFLVVWGEAIKRNYIDVGFDPGKILVNGHPKYKINSDISLTFELNNILVLPKPLGGAPAGDKYELNDRGNCILYLLSVQSVLKKIGISKVRFRPHPSENPNWYMTYLDRDFFTPDTDTLENSLSKSSLVIGVTSTVFLESLINGVSYLVYEPRLENGNGLDNNPVVAPFDGSNIKVPVAKSEDELLELIKQKSKVDLSILSDYIDPDFDAKIILEKIK